MSDKNTKEGKKNGSTALSFLLYISSGILLEGDRLKQQYGVNSKATTKRKTKNSQEVNKKY